MMTTGSYYTITRLEHVRLVLDGVVKVNTVDAPQPGELQAQALGQVHLKSKFEGNRLC